MSNEKLGQELERINENLQAIVKNQAILYCLLKEGKEIEPQSLEGIPFVDGEK